MRRVFSSPHALATSAAVAMRCIGIAERPVDKDSRLAWERKARWQWHLHNPAPPPHRRYSHDPTSWNRKKALRAEDEAATGPSRLPIVQSRDQREARVRDENAHKRRVAVEDAAMAAPAADAGAHALWLRLVEQAQHPLALGMAAAAKVELLSSLGDATTQLAAELPSLDDQAAASVALAACAARDALMQLDGSDAFFAAGAARCASWQYPAWTDDTRVTRWCAARLFRGSPNDDAAGGAPWGDFDPSARDTYNQGRDTARLLLAVVRMGDATAATGGILWRHVRALAAATEQQHRRLAAREDHGLGDSPVDALELRYTIDAAAHFWRAADARTVASTAIQRVPGELAALMTVCPNYTVPTQPVAALLEAVTLDATRTNDAAAAALVQLLARRPQEVAALGSARAIRVACAVASEAVERGLEQLNDTRVTRSCVGTVMRPLLLAAIAAVPTASADAAVAFVAALTDGCYTGKIPMPLWQALVSKFAASSEGHRVVAALVALRLRAISEGSPRAAHDVITAADGAALAAFPSVAKALDAVAQLFPDHASSLGTLRNRVTEASKSTF